MNILLIGGYGLLGSDIFNVLNKNPNYDVVRYTKMEMNLLDRKAVKQKLDHFQPDLIINAAGYTNVKDCEINLDIAFNNNIIALYNLINEVKGKSIPIVHFSTDYVFEGNAIEPYIEEDIKNPINNYGWTKLLSEDLLKANYNAYYIIRTSWLFGKNGSCFPSAILNKLIKGEEIMVVNDQFGTPTYTLDLALLLPRIMDLPYGTYHITNSGYTNWYNFALDIAKIKDLDSTKITPISSEDFDSEIRRPKSSVLSSEKINKHSIYVRHYKEALEEFLENQ